MPDPSLVIFPIITFAAFFIKGATGFGSALLMVPIFSVLIGTHSAIVLSSILDLLGGAFLFIKNPVADSRRFWIPLAISMAAGSIIGGIILGYFPVQGFEKVLGTVIISLGLWFITGRGGKEESTLPPKPPLSCKPADIAVSTFSGLCGGLFGISGPPIVFYLGNRLAKTAFRGVLIAVFMCAGLSRFMTYTVTGLVNVEILWVTLVSIPGLLLGIYCGNHLFIRIPQIWFSRLIGTVLVISAFRLLCQ